MRIRDHFESKKGGQAVVEFTLIFVLLLVLLWIPADFGLAFYTGQLAQNASREGARIAAADPNLLALTGSCTLPCSEPAGSPLQETAERLSSALLPGGTITLTYPQSGSTCTQMLRLTVQGTYNHFFYQLLNFFSVSVNPSLPIVRFTDMRWEHQVGCPPSG
jgi:Flp pilus assembly protein TadG